MRSLSQSRRGSKVTNNLFLVILESAIVCVLFVCICVRLLIGLIFRRSRGRSAGPFPKQRLIEPRLGRYFWLLFVVTFHGVGSGFAGWETLVNFYRWVIDGYASKHNNHDKLYCGNLRFWPLVWKKTKHEAEMVKFLLAEMQSKSTIQKRSQFPVILTKYAGFIIWAKRNFLLWDQHSGA